MAGVGQSGSEKPVLLCQDALSRLEKDLELPDGTLIPKGTLVLLLPQTIADCVMTPDGDSLAEAWPGISREGHTHPEIAQFSKELIELARRVATVESKLP